MVTIPIFKYKTHGILNREWPQGKKIHLLECNFSSDIEIREFNVETEVRADDINEARLVGRNNCYDATNLLWFSIGGKLDLDNNKEDTQEVGSSKIKAHSSLLCKSTIKNLYPITIEQLTEIENVQNNILNTNREENEILIRSIHWWALGKREKDTIHRFIKLWISLEILFEKGDKLKQVTEELSKIYPELNQDDISNSFKPVRDYRNDIIHEGLSNPSKLVEYTKKLEAILEDILSFKLSTNIQSRAKQFF